MTGPAEVYCNLCLRPHTDVIEYIDCFAEYCTNCGEIHKGGDISSRSNPSTTFASSRPHQPNKRTKFLNGTTNPVGLALTSTSQTNNIRETTVQVDSPEAFIEIKQGRPETTEVSVITEIEQDLEDLEDNEFLETRFLNRAYLALKKILQQRKELAEPSQKKPKRHLVAKILEAIQSLNKKKHHSN